MQSRKFFSLILEFVVILFCLSGLTSKTIAIDDHDLYVANDLSQCSGLPQPICFFNDEADTPQSVALNKAMNYVRNHPEGGSYQIHILSPYEIKTASVTIDSTIVLIGEDSCWFQHIKAKSCLEPLYTDHLMDYYSELAHHRGECNDSLTEWLLSKHLDVLSELDFKRQKCDHSSKQSRRI